MAITIITQPECVVYFNKSEQVNDEDKTVLTKLDVTITIEAESDTGEELSYRWYKVIPPQYNFPTKDSDIKPLSDGKIAASGITYSGTTTNFLTITHEPGSNDRVDTGEEFVFCEIYDGDTYEKTDNIKVMLKDDYRIERYYDSCGFPLIPNYNSYYDRFWAACKSNHFIREQKYFAGWTIYDDRCNNIVDGIGYEGNDLGHIIKEYKDIDTTNPRAYRAPIISLPETTDPSDPKNLGYGFIVQAVEWSDSFGDVNIDTEKYSHDVKLHLVIDSPFVKRRNDSVVGIYVRDELRAKANVTWSYEGKDIETITPITPKPTSSLNVLTIGYHDSESENSCPYDYYFDGQFVRIEEGKDNNIKYKLLSKNKFDQIDNYYIDPFYPLGPTSNTIDANRNTVTYSFITQEQQEGKQTGGVPYIDDTNQSFHKKLDHDAYSIAESGLQCQYSNPFIGDVCDPCAVIPSGTSCSIVRTRQPKTIASIKVSTVNASNLSFVVQDGNDYYEMNTTYPLFCEKQCNIVYNTENSDKYIILNTDDGRKIENLQNDCLAFSASSNSDLITFTVEVQKNGAPVILDDDKNQYVYVYAREEGICLLLDRFPIEADTRTTSSNKVELLTVTDVDSETGEIVEETKFDSCIDRQKISSQKTTAEALMQGKAIVDSQLESCFITNEVKAYCDAIDAYLQLTEDISNNVTDRWAVFWARQIEPQIEPSNTKGWKKIGEWWMAPIATSGNVGNPTPEAPIDYDAAWALPPDGIIYIYRYIFHDDEEIRDWPGYDLPCYETGGGSCPKDPNPPVGDSFPCTPGTFACGDDCASGSSDSKVGVAANIDNANTKKLYLPDEAKFTLGAGIDAWLLTGSNLDYVSSSNLKLKMANDWVAAPSVVETNKLVVQTPDKNLKFIYESQMDDESGESYYTMTNIVVSLSDDSDKIADGYEGCIAMNPRSAKVPKGTYIADDCAQQEDINKQAMLLAVSQLVCLYCSKELPPIGCCECRKIGGVIIAPMCNGEMQPGDECKKVKTCYGNCPYVEGDTSNAVPKCSVSISSAAQAKCSYLAESPYQANAQAATAALASRVCFPCDKVGGGGAGGGGGATSISASCSASCTDCAKAYCVFRGFDDSE